MMDIRFRKKTLLIVFAVLFCMVTVLLFSGCTKDTGSPACRDILYACKNIAPDGSFDTMVSYGEELYEESFDNLYGIQYGDISDGAILYTEEGGLADEISIVRMNDNNDISIARQKMTDRIESRRKTFAGYKPEEVQKLDEASVIVQGNYVVLIISNSNDYFDAEIIRVISENN